MRFLFDEGAPVGIGRKLEQAGFEVIEFSAAAFAGDPDPIVADAAMANDATLVAVDRDLRELAKAVGIGRNRYRDLNLLFFRSKGAIALRRVDDVIPYIRLRLSHTEGRAGRRLWIEVTDTAIKIVDNQG